jgi:CBS domain containing-hemolysin-like protein
MVLINALFAAYEIALASVTKTRLESLKNQGRFGATAEPPAAAGP